MWLSLGRVFVIKRINKMLNRDKRVNLANETLNIIKQGYYLSLLGNKIETKCLLECAIERTRTIKPVEDFNTVLNEMGLVDDKKATIDITHESTLEAAKRLYESGKRDIYCLNFASAKNPGGGFLGGSQAQEESLARSSGLYACLIKDMEMYEYNRSRKTMLYSDYMIYSPDVPVFRDDQGHLLDNVYTATFITAPAVNLGALRRNTPNEEPLVMEALKKRLEKILAIAYLHNHKTLLLGAWGCGVFGNDPIVIANLFNEYLGKEGCYRSCFDHIVFAIYGKEEIYQTFLKHFRD